MLCAGRRRTGAGGAHRVGKGGLVREGIRIKPQAAGPMGQGRVGQRSLIPAIITLPTVMG